MLGHYIGNYRLIRLLGEGGMGLVYEAVHEGVGGRAAIKVLKPEVALQKDITARFFNEARAANSISHPGIIHVFDSGYTPDGIAYLTMEFLDGESLRGRLDRVQVFTVMETLRLGHQIASALAAAHQKQVIHRDLKPDNLMLVKDADLPGGERVKILDFGIAKIAETLSSQPLRTRSDMLMGTPSYMAPEQCRGAKHVTDRSDVYSMGIMLYQMLTGSPPFVAGRVVDLLTMHVNDEPAHLLHRLPLLEPQVAALIHSMLLKQPPDRPSMAEVLRGMLRLINAIASSPTLPPRQSSPSISGNLAGPSHMPAQVQTEPAANPTSVRPSPLSVLEPMKLASSQAETTRNPVINRALIAGASDSRTLVASRSDTRTEVSSSTDKRTLVVGPSNASPRRRFRWILWLAIGAALLAGVLAVAIRLMSGPTRPTGALARSVLNPNPMNRNVVARPDPAKPEAFRGRAETSDRVGGTGSARLPAAGTKQPPTELSASGTPPASAKAPPAMDPLLAKAYKAWRKSQFDDAIALTTDCTTAKPEAHQCWWILGLSACNLSRYELIANSVNHLKLDSIKKPELANEVIAECRTLGIAQVSGGRFARLPAASEIEAMLKKATDSFHQQKYADALKIAEAYAEYEPLQMWEIAGQCACALGMPDRANAALSKYADTAMQDQVIRFCSEKSYEYDYRLRRFKKR